MSATLQTKRLILRQPEPGDWGIFRSFMLSDRASHFSSMNSVGAAWRAFAAELGHWEIFGYGMWAVTLRGDNDCLALIGPWTPEDWPETEIGWMVLDPAIEGTGIATEAAQAAITHAWDVLNWRTIVHYIDADNTRSIRLAEKLGAAFDPSAPQPRPDKLCLVYRQPQPETAR